VRRAREASWLPRRAVPIFKSRAVQIVTVFAALPRASAKNSPSWPVSLRTSVSLR